MLLETMGVTMRFGGLTAVNDVTLGIEKGSICGLIGPNGAGKTTLFNILSGVYKPTGGKILFEGEDITGLLPFKVNIKGISRTYQTIHLFGNMTVLENVLIGMHPRMKTGFWQACFRTQKQRDEEKESIARAEDLLDFVNLREKKDQISSSLSYGEQRLLEIVRAMASSPKIILLDEPAAGMNSREKMDLNDTIKKIRDRSMTVLLVDHDMGLVMKATDYIFVLSFGKKIAEGSPSEVKNNPDVIAAYLGDDDL
ncbi:MAG: ABC transporter ATP-binding protein [Synergistaceae bacterium]|jgi:branched-chain amino acid transport system ATP-binding protein|nr:ABC transporter ATP-binding protein [Synergistaceae bacterium]